MMKETPEEDVIEDARRRVFEESESLEDTCTKVKGYDFNNGVNHSEVINFMGSTGFQASHLGIVNHM
ncbi:deoxyhypusine synthase, partial [Tanacetum coccineum]